MEQTPKDQNSKREKIFRISVCAVAILALTAAITYMIRGIILDTNATRRLLASAFMSFEKAETPTNTDTENTTAVPSPDEGKPTDSTTATAPQSVSIVSANLASSVAAITNYTSYSVDETALSSYRFPPYSYTKSPLVLILHSHGDESYAPVGKTEVDSDFDFTNSDASQNIFAVGEAIAEVLNATGINALHISDDASDMEDTVNRYLALYPSIRYVLDVHRDGLYATDGSLVRTDGKVNESPSAQLMLAVGTDMQNSDANWQGNLAAAYRLATLISSAEPSMMRKILLRPEGLGQQYAPCSLSLYVGSTGNTLSEALTAAQFFARYYAIFILSA